MRVFIIIIWLIFGSFGSVILTRITNETTRKTLRGFFFWRSVCPHCNHTLRIGDLIPLWSFFFHGGKCRYCGKKISYLYPILELLSAGIFLGSYIWMGEYSRWIIAFWTITNRLLLLLLIYDVLHYELHSPIWMILVVFGVWGNIFLPEMNLWHAVFSSIWFVGTFILLYLFAKRYVWLRRKKSNQEWLWEGDIYLAMIVWLYLPIIFWFSWISFSWTILLQFIILFLLMSGVLWLTRFGAQQILSHYTPKRYTHTISPMLHHISLKIIPFFPAMILAFWLLAWKADFFISLFFG